MTGPAAPPTAAGDAEALLAQALGQRAQDRRADALGTLARAAQFAGSHPALAHTLAQTRLEAGLPAAQDFLRAIALAPGNTALRLGLAAARFAEGDGARALDELAALLAANPGWAEGHAAFARLCALTGSPGRALETVSAAIARARAVPQLVAQAIDVALVAGLNREAIALADGGEARFGVAELWTETRAIAWDDLGERDAAARAFALLGDPDSAQRAMRLVRHRLRTGAIDEAAALVDAWLERPGGELLWPYAASVWRLADPARAEWLDRDGALVEAVDTGISPGELDALGALLRRFHTRAGEFADQSVRGGSQTDGVLLARIEPEIERLRTRLAEAVRDYVSRLPAPDAAHPTLGPDRTRPIAFAGSWSVRLAGAGRHVAHHHPHGWLSSAFYVTIPDGLAPGEGALELGRPPTDLGLDLCAQATLAPRPGMLALFPSWMWHGTTPFRSGERITVAFDVALS